MKHGSPAPLMVKLVLVVRARRIDWHNHPLAAASQARARQTQHPQLELRPKSSASRTAYRTRRFPTPSPTIVDSWARLKPKTAAV